jgi:leucyl/phenylalanyl-tRNA--protein transferase
MFHTESNASKQCLVAVLSLLKLAGISWLDTQMVTPVVRSLGGVEIPRKEFLNKLKRSTLKTREEIFPTDFNLYDTFLKSELGK